ncbi:MAG TPA: LuxR C-terminal-related transcriptional regulator [Bryobacterales bacterium]|jgi:DNA-binding CsgD family transcriptional regulator/PAS domain-containing protein|nr:LuxR C-terminal-related transcriptional regulator [Bryobacterales bacterium]
MAGRQVYADTVLELTGLIYASVADSSCWKVFLEAFLTSIRGQACSLALRDAADGRLSMNCWYGWSDEDMTLYFESYSAADPWRIANARGPEGAVRAGADLSRREEMEPSAAFREFYAPRGAIHGMGGTILATEGRESIISAVRGACEGPFGEPEKAVLRALMPHLKRAVLLHGELASLRLQLSLLAGHLDRCSHAFFLTDREGRVLYANAAAREIADLRDGLSLEDGVIVAASVRQNAEFREAVMEAAGGRNGAWRRVTISRPSGAEPYRLILMPAKDSGACPGVSRPAASILVIDSVFSPELDVPVLCELFPFTPAEARVAAKLALGRSVEEIAAELRISVETARTHVKRTLSKTATERQGELISLILRSVPVRRL